MGSDLFGGRAPNQVYKKQRVLCLGAGQEIKKMRRCADPLRVLDRALAAVDLLTVLTASHRPCGCVVGHRNDRHACLMQGWPVFSVVQALNIYFYGDQ